MIRRVFVLFLLTAASAFAADPLALVVDGVADGRVSVSKLTSLEVIATNVGSEEPLVFVWISVERKRGDGQFISFRTDVLCPCDHKCRRESFRLKKRESVRGSWDFRSSDCGIASPGIYRFAVIARFSDETNGYVYHGVSNEFEVIE